jgi:GNAT superfamily N-acetyltransferase
LSDIAIRAADAGDREDMFSLYALVVEEGGAFPREPPADETMFREAWMDGKTGVYVADVGGTFAGSYHLLANYEGTAAHIANAGYMVAPEFRRRGVGRALVAHSLEEARRHGFDAMMFNLVLESNPSRTLYEQLGFEAVGRVPEAIRGEDAIVYWRKL